MKEQKIKRPRRPGYKTTSVEVPDAWHAWLKDRASRGASMGALVMEAVRGFYGEYGDPPQD